MGIVIVFGVQWNLRSPTGLGQSDLNGEVTLLHGVICTVEYNLGLSHGDCNGGGVLTSEVTVR